LIITSPPTGVAREGGLEALIAGFIDNVARCLEPGGRLVWPAPLTGVTARQLTALGLGVERKGAVDLGRFNAELQVARGPSGRANSGVRVP
jgi:hypothetical protein